MLTLTSEQQIEQADRLQRLNNKLVGELEDLQGISDKLGQRNRDLEATATDLNGSVAELKLTLTSAKQDDQKLRSKVGGGGGARGAGV